MSLCPFGLTNDPFPGQCARYIDANKNAFCDLSQATSGTPLNNNYRLFEIIIILTLLYGASVLLVNKKLITLSIHKKIWNLFLLITFLVSAILGILLVMKVNYGWQIPTPGSLFWHTEAGIAMIVIAFFHIFWHWKYFKNLV